MAKADQLVNEIEQQIRTGQLAPGDRLPSVREFAATRGLAPNTAAAVYKTLASRGLVQGEGRRGTFVAAKPAVRVHIDEPVPADLVNVANGNPDPSLLPDLTAALARVPADPLLYGREQILPELAQLLRDDVEADGIDADELAVVAGALDGIERVLAAHLRPGDSVGIEDPGYSSVTELVTAMGFRPVPVRVDGQGPDPTALVEAIDRGVAAVIITPRAQNPIGATISGERAEALRRIFEAEPHVLVIEDDHAGPVSGAAHETTIPEGAPHWAVVRSVAKSLGPDLRVSALVGDATTVGRVRGRQAVGTGWVSHILQHAVVAMLTAPGHGQLIDRAAVTYSERRAAFVDRLRAGGVDVEASSGLNVWIPVADEAAVVAGMERRGFAIRSGVRYRLDAPPGVRVTIAGTDAAVLVDVADALVDVLRPATHRRVV
jgi:DNA-binding transcriptional MocR family regulator